MSNTNPLTKDDLIDVLAEFYERRLKPEFENLETRLRGEINSVKTELKQEIAEVKTELKEDIAGVKTEVRWLKDEVSGLKGEFSKQVSREEFNKFKAYVDRRHPSN